MKIKIEPQPAQQRRDLQAAPWKTELGESFTVIFLFPSAFKARCAPKKHSKSARTLFGGCRLETLFLNNSVLSGERERFA